MSINHRLKEIELEDLMAAQQHPDPLSQFNQRTIVRMMLDKRAHHILEPLMPFLSPELFSSNTYEMLVFLEGHAFWQQYGGFASEDGMNNLIDNFKKSTPADHPDFGPLVDLMKERAEATDILQFNEFIRAWIKRQLYQKLVAGEGVEALLQGDYARIGQLIAAAEAGVPDSREKYINPIKDPRPLLVRDATRHLQVALPTLSRVLGTGGPRRGEVLCYLGRTGIGKSIALCNDAVASACARQKTLLVSFEISQLLMGSRCSSILTDIPTSDLINQPEEVLARSARQDERLRGEDTLRVVHLGAHIHSVGKVRSLLEGYRRVDGWEPDVIILDYLELMVPRREPARGENEYNRQKEVANDFTFLAQDQNVLVIAATQANREGAKNEHDVNLQHIAESFGKAMNMDYIVSLNQTFQELRGEGEHPHPMMRFNIIKNREGRLCNVAALVNYDTKKLTEIG